MCGPGKLKVATLFVIEWDVLIAKHMPRNAVDPHTDLSVFRVKHLIAVHCVFRHALTEPRFGYRPNAGFTNCWYRLYFCRFHDESAFFQIQFKIEMFLSIT